jgi:hypothetical protein
MGAGKHLPAVGKTHPFQHAGQESNEDQKNEKSALLLALA